MTISSFRRPRGIALAGPQRRRQDRYSDPAQHRPEQPARIDGGSRFLDRSQPGSRMRHRRVGPPASPLLAGSTPGRWLGPLPWGSRVSSRERPGVRWSEALSGGLKPNQVCRPSGPTPCRIERKTSDHGHGENERDRESQVDTCGRQESDDRRGGVHERTCAAHLRRQRAHEPIAAGALVLGCPACARGADATASTPAPSSRLSVSPPCDRVSSAAVPATDDGSGIQVERTERLMTAVCAIEGPTGSPSAWSAC